MGQRLHDIDAWVRELRADGIFLRGPDGASTIRVRDRVRPLLPARVLVDELAQEVGGGVVAHRRLITNEGEHALVVTVAGRDGEATLGLVLGDDFIARVDARGAGLAPTVESLLRELKLGLGVLRRRRYEYQTPPGWTGRARGLVTEWMPPGFPRELAIITVFPARCASITDDLDAAPAAAFWTGSEAVELVGLTGVLLESATMHRAELTCGRMMHVLQLETDAARRSAFLPLFRRMVDSVKPLPGRALAAQPVVFDHWAA